METAGEQDPGVFLNKNFKFHHYNVLPNHCIYQGLLDAGEGETVDGEGMELSL